MVGSHQLVFLMMSLPSSTKSSPTSPINSKAWIFLIQALLFCAFGSQAQSLNAAWRRLTSTSQLLYSLNAVSVVDELGKHKLVSNANIRMRSASVMKLLTTAAALEVLGKDYTFKTRLHHSGTVSKEGVLMGNLIIEGGYDPTLGSEQYGTSTKAVMAHFVGLIKKTGIQKIEGEVVVIADDVPALTQQETWLYGDIGNYFAPPVSSLNYRENLLKVSFDKTPLGQRATDFAVTPKYPNLKIETSVFADKAGSGDNTVAYGGPDELKRSITGKLDLEKSQKTVKISMPSPGRLFLADLKEALTQAGITTSGQYEYGPLKDDNLKEIGTLNSPTLGQIIKVVNINSHNLFAECVLRVLAQRLPAVQGDIAQKRLQHWYQERQLMRQSILEDGSGLSMTTGITVHDMVEVLQWSRKRPWFQDWFETLPRLGESGTLENIGNTSVAKGLIAAKTGSGSGTVALAGYTLRNGKHADAFCIFVNQVDGSVLKARNAMVPFLEVLVK